MDKLIGNLLEARNRIELIKRDRLLTADEESQQKKIDAQLIQLGKILKA